MTTAAVQAADAAEVRTVILIGNPNTGKTTLFNAFCGARAKTSNFPGTTTAIRRGHARGGPIAAGVEVLDLPGVYDLSEDSPEANIASNVLATATGTNQVVVAIVDACHLARNLTVVGQVIGMGCRLVVALNMVDLAERNGLTIDAAALSRVLDVPVVPIVARTQQGFDHLQHAIADAKAGGTDAVPSGSDAEGLARWADQTTSRVSSGRTGNEPDRTADRVDYWLTHPVAGVAIFIALMAGLFYLLFSMATIPMDLIETMFSSLGGFIEETLPPGPLRDLLIDGIVGGLAGTVVFLPQICLLFFLISLLEDTGYLARAAFVMDRLLAPFGLPGHAFVPLLTSHACALPGIMSTRLIPSRRDRLATILIAPFMSCSARLPVYVLLTSVLFAGRPAAAAAAFAGCYALGATAALLTARLFSSTILPGRPRPMILELPSYKQPSLVNALLAAKDQGLSFLTTAGTAIIAICVVMWWLSAYPKSDAPLRATELRTAAAAEASQSAREELLSEADLLEARTTQANSFAGRIGRTIAPVFEPLGFDWQLTVGIMTSFLAREVFVSTMSVLAGARDDGNVDEGVIDRIGGMTRDDGTLVFTPSTAAAALVFFVLAMQCLPTLTVTRKETGSLKYAALQLFYMSGLAYVAALLVHTAMRGAGLS